MAMRWIVNRWHLEIQNGQKNQLKEKKKITFENFTFKQKIIVYAVRSSYKIKLFTYSRDKS
jgi:hypothetical protein